MIFKRVAATDFPPNIFSFRLYFPSSTVVCHKSFLDFFKMCLFWYCLSNICLTKDSGLKCEILLYTQCTLYSMGSYNKLAGIFWTVRNVGRGHYIVELMLAINERQNLNSLNLEWEMFAFSPGQRLFLLNLTSSSFFRIFRQVHWLWWWWWCGENQ